MTRNSSGRTPSARLPRRATWPFSPKAATPGRWRRCTWPVAERQAGGEAAGSYLEAARAYRQAGLEEEALAAEDRAFAHAPDSDAAFAARRTRVQKDTRALAELLAQRAEAVPSEAPALLKEAAELLTQGGEPVQAAEVWEALLRLRPEDVGALLARGELAAEAGGPPAAQPYDRRAVEAGADTLTTAQRLRLKLRLGHAALASGALQDAADALEEVVAQDAEGERGSQALSLLAEVYARQPGRQGRLPHLPPPRPPRRGGGGGGAVPSRGGAGGGAGRGAGGASALGRVAARGRRVWWTAPSRDSRPPDAPRNSKSLSVRAAEASGGARAAQLLLEAAQVAAARGDEEAQLRHLLAAVQAEPSNRGALEALSAVQRARSDAAGLGRTLESLVALLPLDEKSAALRLEAARFTEGEDAAVRIQALLQPVVDAGPSAAYVEALDLLEPVLSGAPLAHAAALAARAELRGGKRSGLPASRGGGAGRPGRRQRARGAVRAGLGGGRGHPGLAAFVGQPHAAERGSRPRRRPPSGQAAQRSTAQERSGLLLEAAEAWEAAGDEAEARDVLLGLVQAQPEALPPAEWARAPVARRRTRGRGDVRLRAAVGPRRLCRGAGRRRVLGRQTPPPGSAVGPGLGFARVHGGAEARRPRPRGREARRRGCGPRAWPRWCGPRSSLRPCTGRWCWRRASAEDSRYEAGGPRVEALARLVANGEGDVVLAQVLEGLDADAPGALVEAVVAYARGRRGTERERALRLLASRLKERSGPLWQELFQRARDDNRLEEAAEALVGWVEATAEPEKRAALRTQLGDLLLHLGQTQSAEASYTLAASEDAQAPAPLQKLLSLVAAEEAPERFVSLAEQLQALAGPAAVAEVRPQARLGVRAARPGGGSLPDAGGAPGDARASGASGPSSPTRSGAATSPSRSGNNSSTPRRSAPASAWRRCKRAFRSARCGSSPEPRPRCRPSRGAAWPSSWPPSRRGPPVPWPSGRDSSPKASWTRTATRPTPLALRHTGRLLDATLLRGVCPRRPGRAAAGRATANHYPPGPAPRRPHPPLAARRAAGAGGGHAPVAPGPHPSPLCLGRAGSPRLLGPGRRPRGLARRAGDVGAGRGWPLAVRPGGAHLLAGAGPVAWGRGGASFDARASGRAWTAWPPRPSSPCRPLWRRRASFSSSTEACAAQTWKAWTWPKSSKAAGPSTPSSSGPWRSCRVVEAFFPR